MLPKKKCQSLTHFYSEVPSKCHFRFYVNLHLWSTADVFCIFHYVKRTLSLLKTWPITLLISNTLGMTIYGPCRLATASIIIYIMIRLSYRTEAICCTSSRAACLTHSLVWTGTHTHKVIIRQSRPTAQIQSHFPFSLMEMMHPWTDTLGWGFRGGPFWACLWTLHELLGKNK